VRVVSPPREQNANVFAADGDFREGAADAYEHQGNARKIVTAYGIGTAPPIQAAPRRYSFEVRMAFGIGDGSFATRTG